MGFQPMKIAWHGLPARVPNTQAAALLQHMGESPMPHNPQTQTHGLAARATKS